ncbi:MAG: LbetaH domain-containing protein [Isosphaeraceae bacterium]
MIIERPVRSLIQTWSPIIAGACGSILILALVGPTLRRSSADTHEVTEQQSMAHARRRRGPLSWLVIGMALVGLNVAAAVSSPPVDRSGLELARRLFEGGIHVARGDGKLDRVRASLKLAVIVPDSMAPGAGSHRDRRVGGQEKDYYERTWRLIIIGDDEMISRYPGIPITISTIRLCDDGSLIGHEGRPGDLLAGSVVLRNPTRSFLEVWWAVIGSGTITIAVAAGLLIPWGFIAPGGWLGRPGGTGWSKPGWNVLAWAATLAILAWLNVVGAIESQDRHLRDYLSRVRTIERWKWQPTAWNDVTGETLFGIGRLSPGVGLRRMMILPQPLSLPETWSPLIATVSLSILVIHLQLGRPIGCSPSTEPGRADRRWSDRMVIGAALLALNMAAACCDTYPRPGSEEPFPPKFLDASTVSDEDGSLVVEDSSYHLIRKLPGSTEVRPVSMADYAAPRHQFDTRLRIKDTVIYNSDGSVVAYPGKAGFLERLISRPLVLHPATRSLLEVWWPVLTSASVSVIFLLWLRLRPGRRSA